MASEDGELSPEALAQLDSLNLSLREKVDGCCRFVRASEAAAAAYGHERARIARHETAANRSAQRVKEYIQRCLLALNTQQVETPLFKVRLQKNPPKVEVAAGVLPEELPAGLVRSVPEVDKAAVLEAYRLGQELPPGVTVSQSLSLRIS